jgi:hypothetical protein
VDPNQAHRVVWVVRAVGLLMFFLGVGSLVLAPLEMICFSWFSEDGRFGYDGFGFGSFMFGNLAMQILGYYVIALVAIPLGWGHLKLRRWARPAALALVQAWWALGVPLLLVFLFVLFSAKDLSVVFAGVAVVLAGLSYVALPGLMTRGYRNAVVRAAFERERPSQSWVERLGTPLLTVGILEAFFVLALQVLVFFGGLFPLITTWARGLTALALIDASIVLLLLLLWGTLTHRLWAWWGGLVYFAAMGALWVITLVRTSWMELLDVMAFPPTEVAILDGIPLQGWHLAALLALPLAGTLTIIARARRQFLQARSGSTG